MKYLICFKPTEKIKKEINNLKNKLDKKLFLPIEKLDFHSTIYWEFFKEKNEENIIDLVRKEVRKLKPFLIKSKVSPFLGFGVITLQLNKSKILIEFHKNLVEKLDKYRDCDFQKKLIEKSKILGEKQNKYELSQYKNEFILEKFKSHITICRMKSEDMKKEVKKIKGKKVSDFFVKYIYLYKKDTEWRLLTRFKIV